MTHETAVRLIRERSVRRHHIPKQFTTGAPWAMLLDLFANGPSPVSSLCYASGAPHTTALRYQDKLVAARLIDRCPASHDRRLIICGLTEQGRAAMDAYCARLEAA